MAKAKTWYHCEVVHANPKALWPGLGVAAVRTRIDSALYMALRTHYDVMDGLSLRDVECAWISRRAIGDAFKLFQTSKAQFSQSIPLAHGYVLRLSRFEL